MPTLRLLTPTIIALLGALAAQAGSSGLIVTFENIPNRIRRDNPELAAARFRIAEARGHLRQAGRLPNPELGVGLEHNHRFQEGSFEFELSQRFPVTDRLLREKTISALEVRTAEAEVTEVERQLVASARSTLVEVLALRQQRQLRQEQAAVAKALVEFVSKAAEAGELSAIDAGQARLDAARYPAEIRQLTAQEVAALGSLKPLLGMKTNEVLNVTGSLPPATLPDDEIDLARRPDYQARQLAAQAAREGVSLEEARRYEDIEAGLAAGLERSEDAPEGFETEGIVGLRLKVALPFWDKNEGNIEAAKARAERHQHEIKALAHQIRHEADAARREMAEWNKMINEISDSLLPLAAEQAAQSQTAYRDGFADLQTVLRAREQELQLAASQIEALRNFHLARIRFEAAIAKP